MGARGKESGSGSSSPAPRPYRRGVGVMLLNGQGLVFAGRRRDVRGGAWQMPQGGIDEDEDPRDAAFRELEEEIGTGQAEIIAESARWYCYDLPADLARRAWGGRFRGQSQKWFAMRFLGRDEDINVATAQPEFVAWRWVPLAELPGLIVPFKRKLYDALLAEFGHLAAPGPESNGASRSEKP